MRDDEIRVLGYVPKKDTDASKKISSKNSSPNISLDTLIVEKGNCDYSVYDDDSNDFDSCNDMPMMNRHIELPSITFKQIKKRRRSFSRFIWIAIIIISGLIIIAIIVGIYLPQKKETEDIESLKINYIEKIGKLHLENDLLREKIMPIMIHEAINKGCPKCHSHKAYRIVYGLFSDDVIPSSADSIIPGSGIVNDQSNYLRCKECGYEYGNLHDYLSE